MISPNIFLFFDETNPQTQRFKNRYLLIFVLES